MSHPPLPFRRLLVGATVFLTALALASVLFPPGVGRYAAYLLAFALWMAWFVQTVADSLRQSNV